MNHFFDNATRRNFLKHSASVGALAGLPCAANLMAMGAAHAAPAAPAADYKALVCIYLSGGNDQSNTLVPTSTTEYEAYKRARTSLALGKDQLLQLNPRDWSGPTLAMHGSLSGLKDLFDQGKVAALANVGALIAPTTRDDVINGKVRTPFQLFSHADQNGAWHTGLPDRPSATGWFGRMGDLTATTYNAGSGLSIAMSIAGNNALQTGNSTIQYQLTTSGAVRVEGLSQLQGSAAAGAALRKLTTEARGAMLLENELTKVSNRAISVESLVRTALAGVNVTTPFPATEIGKQLHMVARMVAAREALGQKRQLFYVQLGGFDFHDQLLAGQGNRLKELSDAMTAFYQATVALGVSREVVSFTASEFGRALQSNGRGSDHGWGGHHFVMGDAVLGNRLYGKFPTVALKGPEDVGQGRLMPTTSVDEYASTLASWFGVADSDMKVVVPNIGRFSQRNLGFLNRA